MPPTAVTDTIVQQEVQRYVAANGTDYSTVYEVFTPAGHYSQDGNSTSCGGPNLAYCAYHSRVVEREQQLREDPLILFANSEGVRFAGTDPFLFTRSPAARTKSRRSPRRPSRSAARTSPRPRWPPPP